MTAGMRHAGYSMSFDPSPNRIRVVFNGQTVADSNRAMILRETRLPPVYYFPRDDVRMELFRRTDHRTHCPFKGNAAYWTVAVDGQRAENAAWSYEDPFEDAAQIKDYIALYWDRMDAWFADGEHLDHEGGEGTVSANHPFAGWLIRDASQSSSVADLMTRLADQMVASGMPLMRMRVLLRTLHPQLFATSYTWERKTGAIEAYRARHEILGKREYLESPYAAILDGAGGVRRRLEGAEPRFDFPILKELHADGATDYVAMPMTFSDGQVNILTLIADGPGGFSTSDLGHLHEILPVLSRLFEVHALRLTAVTLLDTYIGKHTGQRVLDGQIKRGDGEDLHAVIWFCDLRSSTSLTEALARDAYLNLLNQYFDCMAGAVLDHGGEVLKFIGDAVLAIFPIGDGSQPSAQACANAVAAARDAYRRITMLNTHRRLSGVVPVGFGVALRLATLLYGNVGISERLDFTVVGATVNVAARIEGLCKTLGHSILFSEAFAEAYEGELTPLGEHSLRGVTAKQKIFTLASFKEDG